MSGSEAHKAGYILFPTKSYANYGEEEMMSNPSHQMWLGREKLNFLDAILPFSNSLKHAY